MANNDVISIRVCVDRNVGGLYARAIQADGQERDVPLDEEAIIDCDGDPEEVDDEIRERVRLDALVGSVPHDCDVIATEGVIL